MKFIKRTIIIVMILSFIMGESYYVRVYADADKPIKMVVFRERQDIPRDKNWNIYLKDPIESLENVSIRIKDSKGQTMYPNVVLSQDGKDSIIVEHIEGGYKWGENYSLEVVYEGFYKLVYILDFKIKDFTGDKMNRAIENGLDGEYTLNPDKYGIQVLYTEVERDESGEVTLNTYKYNVEDNKYFYPASTIKLSACIMAMDRVNRLGVPGLSIYTNMKTKAQEHNQTEGEGTLAGYINSILMYSDNDSFSRIYEFLGQEYYNQRLKDYGFYNTRVSHRLTQGYKWDDNRFSNPIEFLDKEGNVIYEEKLRESGLFLNNSGMDNLIIGWDDKKDFTYKNFSSIYDLQDMMKVIFLDDYRKEKGIYLSKSDLNLLKRGLKNTSHKYLLCGGDVGLIPEDIEIYNKYGQAYGHVIDNAFFRNKKTGKEFFLTAVTYYNENGKMDDLYSYKTVNHIILKQIGEVILKLSQE